MRYFSMFTGVGGFELGIRKAYNQYEPKKRESEEGRDGTINKPKSGFLFTNNPPLCVGVCEWDKYSSIVLEKRFPGVKNYGDATKINTEELPDFDLLVGGFPCQAFSLAGKRRGFKDTRGTMFFEIARILEAKRPEYCVLENVKGLLSHDKGKTFGVILSTLQELGYDVEWGVLNSRYFGVPQNRERVFIIGRLRERGRTKVFPLKRISGENNGEIKKEIHPTITEAIGRGGSSSEFLRSLELVNDLYAVDVYNKKLRKDCPTLTDPTHNSIRLMEGMRIRKLTPRECERLQGFPDDWTLVEMPNGKMMSDTQRYKQMGNAVTVNVIEAIILSLKSPSVKSEELLINEGSK